MKKNLILLILSIFIAFAFSISSLAAGNPSIKFKIISKISPDEAGHYLVSCKHLYSVDLNGVEIIPPTQFPDNQTTVIELPKTQDTYIMHFYDDRTYKSGAAPRDKLTFDLPIKGDASSEITFTAGFIFGGGHGLEKSSSFGSNLINSLASSSSGETNVPVPLAVVIALAGALVAGAVAGASGAAGAAGTAASSGAAGFADNGNAADKKTSDGKSYKMCINKDFGDKIKYNGDTLFIYARMVEVTAEGAEIERTDLTQKIEIFSAESFLQVSPAILQGSYMASSIDAAADKPETMPKEGVISFRFIGEGGIFQNNVTFNMVGECYIEVEGGKLYALSASGKRYEHPYRLMNFITEADVKVTVNAMQSQCPFDIEIGKDKEGHWVIAATDHEEKKPFDGFFDSYPCEIIAQSNKEYARTVFDVVMCHEGLLPDFLGKPKEIYAYKDSEDKMKETIIAFRLGVWNEQSLRLEFQKPGNIEIAASDGDGIFEVINMDFQPDPNAPDDDSVRFIFKAEKNLPAPTPIEGVLNASCAVSQKNYESETPIRLIPDIQQYEKDFEKEYQNCIKIINTYLPENFRAKKMQQLETAKTHLGIEDLKLFRQNIWQFASRCIMQEKESYLIASYWYDEAIATAEFAVYIGDTALDIALAPFGGPIAGFVVGQVKSSLIDIIIMRVEKGGLSYANVGDFICKRFVQIAGQADGAFEMPSAEKPKLLVAWMACYILYRFSYHWWFDKEDDGTPKGIYAAIENGLLDFAGKGASAVLGEFTKDIAKKNGWDKYSIAETDQKITNTATADVLKTGLAIGDSAADKLDTLIANSVKTLMEYSDKIRQG